jgi:hypothetical protein
VLRRIVRIPGSPENVLRSVFGAVVVVAAIATASPVDAADVPAFMKEVVVETGKGPTPAQTAFGEVYALNENMFGIYESALTKYKRHIRERVPLILGLFSGKGGQFFLYRPGQEPIEAPSPPAVYQLAKSVGHSAMATYQLVAPTIDNPGTDRSWVGPMKAYRSRIQVALDNLDALDIAPSERDLLRSVLSRVAAFHDNCLKNGTYTYAEVESYARGLKPQLAQLIGLASGVQVAHWFKVLEGWKQMLGPDWERTYAVSNAIYVARQNNILFSVLAQFMGEKAINDRLLLIETTDFTTTPATMIDVFARIVSDRALGQVFFGDYRLMDAELLGGGGRKAIEAEMAKRNMKALLPPMAPYNSTQWPWRTDVKSGTGPATMEEVR